MSELNMIDIDLEIIDEQQMELLIEEIGPRGPIGPTPDIQIGTVQSVPPSQDPEVTVTGTPEEPYLNFKLKQGEKGEKGDPGDPSVTMTGATATTPGEAGSVTAPAAGDQDKALFGDATWKKPGLVNSDVENSLTQTTAGKVLDATQGKVLDDKITSLATTVGQNHGNIKKTIGIAEDGNVATQAISAGQYVIWKDALYTADAPISIGETLAASGGSKNLTAKLEGVANALVASITPQILHETGSNKIVLPANWSIVHVNAICKHDSESYTRCGGAIFIRSNVEQATSNNIYYSVEQEHESQNYISVIGYNKSTRELWCNSFIIYGQNYTSYVKLTAFCM